MRTRRVQVMSLGVLLLGSAVFAEPSPDQQPAPPSTLAQQLASVEDQVKARHLTPQQMLDEAQAARPAQNAALLRVVKLRELAKRKNDMIKYNCINQRPIDMRAFIRVGDKAIANLTEAVATAQTGTSESEWSVRTRTHEFARATIVQERVAALGGEAENCIGEDVSYLGNLQVEQEIDDSIPDDDPAGISLDEPNDTTRPSEASPFF